MNGYIQGSRSEALPTSDHGTNATDEDEETKTKIARRLRLDRDPKVLALLNEVQNDKMLSLYVSCADLPLNKNAPLIAVGLWALLTTACVVHAGEDTKLNSYFSHQLLERIGIEQGLRRDMIAARENINRGGNATKHSAVAATFDGSQLANDFDVIKPAFVRMLEDTVKRKENQNL